MRLQQTPLLTRHDADLRKPPRKFGRRIDLVRKRVHADRQRRIIRIASDMAPVHGRFIGHRGIQIVAERCTERAFVTWRDAQFVDHRRQAVGAHGKEQLGQRLDFRPELARSKQRGLAFSFTGPGLDGEFSGALLGGQRLCLDPGCLAHEPLAGLGELLEAFRVRRPGGNIAQLGCERAELVLDALDLPEALCVRTLVNSV
jgi:hypothetical protein